MYILQVVDTIKAFREHLPQPTLDDIDSLRLSLPQQDSAVRASKVLNSISTAEWTSFAKDGAPDAWQVKRKGTRKSNTMLRKELAHISYLRDVQRQTGAQSTPPAWSRPVLPATGDIRLGTGGGRAVPSGVFGGDVPLEATSASRGGNNTGGGRGFGFGWLLAACAVPVTMTCSDIVALVKDMTPTSDF